MNAIYMNEGPFASRYLHDRVRGRVEDELGQVLARLDAAEIRQQELADLVGEREAVGAWVPRRLTTELDSVEERIARLQVRVQMLEEELGEE